MLPNAQRAVFNPLQGFTGDIGLIIPDFLENKVHIGTRSSKFYSYAMDGIGTSSTPLVTRWMPLGGNVSISRINIDFPNGIGGSDDFVFTVLGADSSSAAVEVTQAKYGNKTSLQRASDCRLQCQQVRRHSVTCRSGVKIVQADMKKDHKPDYVEPKVVERSFDANAQTNAQEWLPATP